jgi:hypothetical protein
LRQAASFAKRAARPLGADPPAAGAFAAAEFVEEVDDEFEEPPPPQAAIRTAVRRATPPTANPRPLLGFIKLLLVFHQTANWLAAEQARSAA